MLGVLAEPGVGVGCGEKREENGIGSGSLKHIDRRTEKLLREIIESMSLKILFHYQYHFYSEILYFIFLYFMYFVKFLYFMYLFHEK